ncbi:oligosaccharide flippase family protein, partial [Escherichia coli]|nr:oligosaccharide flippase family protein [Escherichia coli]
MSGVKKKLLKNFFSLSMLQGLNYLIPIITMPYLFRTLGPYYFG